MAEGKRGYDDLSPKQQRKFRAVMREYAARTLHHGSTGKVVTDRKTAVAIAFSEAEKVQ